VRYYLAAQLSNSGVNVDPPAAPAQTFGLQVLSTSDGIEDQEFEAATTGWSIENSTNLTAGGWVAGIPNPTTLGGNFASPQTDATPAPGVRAFVTGLGTPGGVAGAQDVDAGTTTLVSPSYDLAGASSATMSVALWYFCDDALNGNTAQVDYLRVEASNGGAWTLVEEVRTVTTAWTTKTVDLADFIALTGSVRVRFVISDIGNNSVTEAGVDDFSIVVGTCVESNCPADLDGDGTVGSADLSALLNAWGSPKGDLDGDGVVGSSDLALVLNAWGACP
jgi:hypothetical protein